MFRQPTYVPEGIEMVSGYVVVPQFKDIRIIRMRRRSLQYNPLYVSGKCYGLVRAMVNHRFLFLRAPEADHQQIEAVDLTGGFQSVFQVVDPVSRPPSVVGSQQ